MVATGRSRTGGAHWTFSGTFEESGDTTNNDADVSQSGATLHAETAVDGRFYLWWMCRHLPNKLAARNYLGDTPAQANG
jgi:hypothetical protein